MSSNEYAERLANALYSLQFVEPVSLEETEFGTVNVLCRIKPPHLAKWAKVVGDILKREKQMKDHPSRWDSMICRLYMLNDQDKLVYGWLVSVTSPHMQDSLSEIIPLIKSHVPRQAAERANPRTTRIPFQPPTQSGRPVPIVRRERPQPDAKGNPIVPNAHKVTEIPMAGMDPLYDRNAPSDDTEGKGAHGMFKSARWGSPFRPPVRG